MAKTLEELFPHKFSVGDTVKVVARGESEWCKIGDTHKVRVCQHNHEDGAVYVVDDDDESAYIRECNLELVERDRQKGGEWKRHRGGKQPVENRVRVECKLRCGDIQQGASDDFLWPHADCDVSANIMQYRVISQPQAEEVEVKDIYAVDNTNYGIPEVTFCETKTDQIDGPLVWRDTVNELDAYIEEFTRERESLINRLALEGFALLPAMTPVMGVADISFPIDEWQIGDIVEVVSVSCESAAPLGVFKITDIDSLEPKYELDDQYFPNHDQMKFIHRP